MERKSFVFMRIYHLTCDTLQNPLGYDFHHPRFGWRTEDAEPGGFQSAYQLQVFADPEFFPESPALLDTGKVLSDLSAGIELSLSLQPRTRYAWRVRIWNQRDEASLWSDFGFFETAKREEAWQAKWIGWSREFPQLRGDFSLEKPIRRARAYACGVGLYELFCNGQRVGKEYLAPGFNAYDNFLQYQTWDLTPYLRRGKNALGAWLGNGYFKGRVNWPEIRERFGDRTCIYGDRLALICEIHVDFTDGSHQVFISDESWRVMESPFLRAEIYDGEVYDARKFREDWCMPEAETADWDPVVPVDMSAYRLIARLNPAVTLHEACKPQRILRTPAGETVLDFGQNRAGLLSFRTEAPAGAELLFQFGEALDKEGNFYRENMRTALAEIRYIADGQLREYSSHFTFFGFRYVRVTGWPGEIHPGDFTSVALYSEMEPLGSFSCSDEKVNQLFRNSLWSMKSNFVDNPTDCPQRDERLGWTGDAQVYCATACMNMNTDIFFRKYLYDLSLEQRKDVYVPVVVPNILRATGIWQLPIAGWSDAATIIPWTLYLHYADRVILRDQYESMKAWVDFISAQDPEEKHLYGGFHLGDWLAQDTKDPNNWFGLTPPDLIATAYYALSARIVGKTAAILGRKKDAEAYSRLADQVAEAFRREYVSPNGRVVSETQTAQAVALYFDLLLPEQRPVAARHLAERLRIDHSTLTTGFIGTPCICPALSENGYNEYAYALLLQENCPSWLYEVNMGATTTWERWNSVRPDGSFGPVGMNSLNHYAFGAVCQWLYQTVAGINPLESAPGFKEVRLRPLPNSLLRHAEASLESPYGRIASAWALQEDGSITLRFEVPFNVRAEFILPDVEGVSDLTENQQSLDPQSILERGCGIWEYRYHPNGRTIDKRVIPDSRPDI